MSQLYMITNEQLDAEANEIRERGIAGQIEYKENGFADAIHNIKNVQCSPVMSQVKNKTSYTPTGSSIVVSKSGYYQCYWVHYATSNGTETTYATRLYVDENEIGSVHICPQYNSGSNFIASESNIYLTKGQTIEVYARTRSGSYYTNYYTTSGMLIISEL